MSDVFVIDKPNFYALAVHKVVGTFSLGKAMKPAYCMVMEKMQETGLICPRGMVPFTRYNRIDWSEMEKRGLRATLKMLFAKKWDMDIGIPVDRMTEIRGEVSFLDCRLGRCVSTVHIGPYQKVSQAYTRVLKMARDQGLALADHSYELYLNDPNDVPPGELRTEILIPIIL
ncbi:MAG TPA: GyrI-like domain-containing protein [Spirochaetota bacterium]|mgnify:CR=1 FL=1|nr:GyrI-like domain-containing protein [Spirochaetota bacterium]